MLAFVAFALASVLGLASSLLLAVAARVGQLPWLA
jgi:hypothetical protein